MTVATSSGLDADPYAGDGMPPRAITWRDLVWLTWREHRALIAGSVLVTAVASGVLLTFAAMLHHYGSCIAAGGPRIDACYSGYRVSSRNFADVLRAVIVLPALTGAFWGAPMLTRPLESGTLWLAFGQDLSPRRWLSAKITVLTAVLVLLALAVSGCCHIAVPTTHQSNEFGGGFDNKIFETGPFPFTGYVLVAFGLGIAVGALIRRTLPAVAIAGAGFFLIWYLLRILRPWYLPARTVTLGADDEWPRQLNSTWNFRHSYSSGPGTPFETITYQVPSHVHWLPLIEFCLCLTAAVVFASAALAIVGRRRA